MEEIKNNQLLDNETHIADKDKKIIHNSAKIIGNLISFILIVFMLSMVAVAIIFGTCLLGVNQ